MIFDTHTHLYWRSFDEDRDEVLKRARDAGVSRFVVVGTDVETSRAALELASREEGMHASVGIHPNDLGVEGPSASDLATIAELAREELCVAVGETGLDYYWDRVPAARQIAGLRWHLELSAAVHKPVIIHSRDAHEDTARILAEGLSTTSSGGPGGVMHCFTMGPEELAAYTALDMYVSFSGVVTYPKNDANREAARLVPADRLLVETDCPFLAPQVRRGKRNEPALVAAVVDVVAEVRETSSSELAATTMDNGLRFFGLPPA